MKKKMKNILFGILTCGVLSTATVGVTLGVSATAASGRVKPTGTNTEILTQEISDTELDTFKVFGASTGKKELLGFRFLATIENSDLALIPNTAEFGMLLIPHDKLGDAELTEKTSGVFVAPALVDTVSDDVPVNGMGYYITLMGETLESSFPENLYDTVLVARAYVKYTYTANGETITDYAYSKTDLDRSIAYVASCELAMLENKGEADTNASSHLNTIIAQTTVGAELQIASESIKQGDVVEVSLSNATDSVNNYAYNLTSSNEDVAIITANGEVKAVGTGTTVITATIGAKTISKEITIGEKTPEAFEGESVLYSTQDGVIFMPDGLLGAEETIVSAIGTEDGVDYFNKGTWNALALNSTEINANTVRVTPLTVWTSEGDAYYVNANSYAGVIDELSDFPKFFNNDASAVAPNVYGYYIVTKSLGTGSETLAFTQTASTDYSATNGFNGVLDGQGHTLKFKLTSGGLVGMILGNAVIKDTRIIFEDATSTGYGVFGYMTNGAPEIRNCYIEQTNNHFKRTTVYGLIARGNGKFRLHNTVVYGYNFSMDNISWSNVHLNETSSNAYVIHARSGATSFAISKNFTKVINDGIENGARELALSEVADASGFNACWSQENGVITWKGAEDMAVSVYDKKHVEIVEEKAYYSTVNSEMILPEGMFADGETIVDARGKDGADYYENGTWNNLAVSTSANETKETTLILESSKGYFYQVTVGSYAGVIDELSDFPKFFNNDASAVAPNVYGYYIVTKDLGTGSEELAFTQTTNTSYAATNGFNGVLDGQGHTLKFKLTSGGLVGMILGNAVVQNLGIIFEDATSTGYGIFGYMTNGAPEIRNCYIEQTNNHFKKTTVYGLMARGNGKLRLHNTVVYGYNISMDNTSWSNVNLNDNSSNAYVIHARSGANNFAISKNFTKVFNDGLENGSRHVLLSEIADARGFDNNYWYKKDGKLIWKGLDVVNVSWVNGLTTTREIYTKGSVVQFPELTESYWSATENGDPTTLNGVLAQEDCTYYAVYADKIISENALYSTLNNEFFLPDSMGLDMSDIVYITNEDGTLTYYEDGEWSKGFALTGEQIQANETSETAIKVYDGESNYFVTVKSYAGILDELSDFPKFFNNQATSSGIAPTTYGHYVIIKNIGSLTDDLAMTQCDVTDYSANCGFSGVVDGLGHTVQFNLTSGSLFGMILGNCTIQNLAVVYTDNTAGDFGAFGFLTHGAPQIINCYIAKQNNRYQKGTTYGIMARPNGKLVLKNTVVFGSNVTMDNSLYASTATISAASNNAFVIWGRTTSTTINTNFTQVSTNGAITGDLSILDSTYWTTADNKPAWKGLADTAVTTFGELEIVQQYLANDGATEYAIVLPDGADDTLILAKDELVSFFEEATGATLTVAADSAYDKNSTYISIGDTKAFAASGLTLGNVNSQGYCINTKKNMIYINANSSLGCVYGVYGLLNELFDYEQFSVDCYTLNGASTVEVPVLNVTENPSFETRYPVSGTVTANDAYAMRLKTADMIYVLPAGDYRYNNDAGWRDNHNVLEILPPAYWKAQGKTNWFSDDGDQLCYTAHGNSADYAAMVAQIVDAMTLTIGSDTFFGGVYANAKYIAISGEDGDGHCTCSACQTAKATYGSDAGAAIKLCNDVREGLETWMNNNPKYKRDLTLLFLAYNKYFDAPVEMNQTTGKYELKGGLTLRSDVGVWVAGSSYAQYYYDIDHANNADFKDAFQRWVDVTEASGSDLCVWTYSLNNNEYLIHTDMYGENTFFNEKAYQYFESKGVDMYYNQGPWNATETVTAFNRLNIYLDAQLQWDSTQSVTELTNKYFNAMYGAGASYMKQLYNAENAASRELFDPDIVGVPNDQTNSFESWFGVLSSSNINKWLGYITSAKNAVNADTTLTDEQKAAYIDHINEEWIAVKYWQMRYHGSSSSLKATAKEEFREVLGYNATTGKYGKDVTIGERYKYTLTAWIENNFSAP